MGISGIDHTWLPTGKQKQALDYLLDKKTTQLLFGGGAGGSKTYLGSAWSILMCLWYPGVRGVIARRKLTELKATTLKTFFEVAGDFGLIAGIHYDYKEQKGEIKFFNGSEIILKELFPYPSDPEFDSLGSLEITFAFVDEANQVPWKAIEVLQTRIRYMLDKYDLLPKMLFTCNPAKNWVKIEFYDPWKEGKLDQDKQFIQALATDNPYISQKYIDNLRRTKNQATKERLLHGNWDYDDDPARLFDIDMTKDFFTNTGTPGPKFMTCDPARMGKDSIAIGVWEGLQLKKIIMKKKQTTDITANDIKKIAATEQIRHSHIAIDVDGLGAGVVDQVKGSVGFLNGGAAVKIKNDSKYQHLKAQCYFKLAELGSEGKIGITCDDPDMKNMIIEELSYVKEVDMDKDGTRKITPKESIKQDLGRSPDLADMIMMRMYFELKPPRKLIVAKTSVY